jgi:hypothetical protein
MTYHQPRPPKCGWGAWEPLIQQLAKETLDLPNKEAFQTISERLTKENTPGLTGRQRCYLRQPVWEARLRLKRLQSFMEPIGEKYYGRTINDQAIND